MLKLVIILVLAGLVCLFFGEGDIVDFKGSLVKVDGPNAWNWSSSLTRDDVGNHACEVVWVTSFNII
ncbi:MAG: hypothetical protein ABIA63_10060 [bacterium]